MSVLKQIVQLRDRFTDITSDNVSFMNALLMETSAPAQAKSVVGLNDDVISLGTDNYLTITSKVGETLNSINLSDFSLEDRATDLLSCDVGDYFLGDVLAVNGESSDLYTSLSLMLTKYTYSNRVSYSDISNILENTPSSDDVSKLRTALFQCTNEDGYISSPSFFSVLKEIFSNTKDSSDAGSTELDRDNPFTLNVLLNIVTDGLITALSTILVAIRSVFTVVIGLIVFVFQAAFNLFKYVASTKLSYDYNKSIDLVKCPVLAMEGLRDYNPESFTLDYWNVEQSHPMTKDRGIICRETYGLAVFKWWNEDYTDFRFNAYEYPWVDPYRLMRFLLRNQYASISSNHLIISNHQRWTDIASPNTPQYRSLETYCAYDQLGYRPANDIEVQLSLIMGCFLRVCIEMTRQGLNDGTKWINIADPAIIAFADPDEQVFQIVGYIAGQTDPDDSFENNRKKLLYDSKINNFYNYLCDNWCTLVKDRFLPHNSNPFGEKVNNNYVMIKSDSSSYYNWYMPYSLFAGTDYCTLSSLTINMKIYDGEEYTFKPDALPSDFAIEYPASIGSEVVGILLGVAAITTAAAVVTRQISKTIAKRKIGKQALTADKINRLRTAYLADPTNSSKRSQYENAVYSYNKWGSIFGWGSFDTKNGWFDTPAQSSESIISNFASNYTNNAKSILDVLLLIDPNYNSH